MKISFDKLVGALEALAWAKDNEEMLVLSPSEKESIKISFDILEQVSSNFIRSKRQQI